VPLGANVQGAVGVGGLPAPENACRAALAVPALLAPA
jgi:hypothetical protein